MSCGSGALVAVSQEHGLVVTNWHVVREAKGQITVVFPDGFRSAAKVVKSDRDWDLAALAIWRPNAEPIPLAIRPPRPGEPLTIAGYGKGRYRTATGRCTQYVSPGMNRPFEMVELSAGARQGDSGGPILNGRGELAGVLFGTAFGRTTGSYCGRVRWFLIPVSDEFRNLDSKPTMIARLAPLPPAAPATPTTPASPTATAQAPETSRFPTVSIGARASEPERPTVSIRRPPPQTTGGWTASPPQESGSKEAQFSKTPEAAQNAAPADPTRADQVKTILAVVGALSILLHGLRLLGAGGGD